MKIKAREMFAAENELSPNRIFTVFSLCRKVWNLHLKHMGSSISLPTTEPQLENNLAGLHHPSKTIALHLNYIIFQ